MFQHWSRERGGISKIGPNVCQQFWPGFWPTCSPVAVSKISMVSISPSTRTRCLYVNSVVIWIDKWCGKKIWKWTTLNDIWFSWNTLYKGRLFVRLPCQIPGAGNPIGKSYGDVPRLWSTFSRRFLVPMSLNFKSICSSGAPTLNFCPKSSKVAQIARWHLKVAQNQPNQLQISPNEL